MLPVSSGETIMTSQPRKFEIGYYYHSYSRGVNKDLIFKNSKDYLKFMSLVTKFNCKEKQRELQRNRNEQTKLVKIFCYTLMPNHFHFLLKELTEGGISKFLQKVLSQYTKYYNNKYKRSGPLFDSRFKDKLVDSDHYFEHLVGYIWNNPIKLINPKYKSIDLFYGKNKLSEKEKSFAINYSYKLFPKDYLGPEHKKENDLLFENLDF
jgi:putative transposase